MQKVFILEIGSNGFPCCKSSYSNLIMMVTAENKEEAINKFREKHPVGTPLDLDIIFDNLVELDLSTPLYLEGEEIESIKKELYDTRWE